MKAKKALRKIGKYLGRGLYYLLAFIGILIVVGLIMLHVAGDAADDLEEVIEFWED